jgi:hypothetical protein
MIEVFPCGEIVRTIIGDIEGMITAVCIRFEEVRYEISYFVNQEQCTVWMNEKEFRTNITKIPIGFKK